MLTGQVTHSYLGNTCNVVIPHKHTHVHPSEKPDGTGAGMPAAEPAPSANVATHVDVEHISNCDIFIGDNDLYFYADVKLYKFHSRRTFDLKQLKTVCINFDTVVNCYQLYLPCLPSTASAGSGGASGAGCAGSANAVAAKPKTLRKEYIGSFMHMPTMAQTLRDNEPIVQEWKLKRITEQCQLQLDGQERSYKLTNIFGYGYASKYSGMLLSSEIDKTTCRVSEPQRLSPIQRRLERIIDEMKRFSREQYKLNFVELQVPPGHQNPMRYKPKIYETSMTQEQAHLLHNLSCRARDVVLSNRFVQKEIDCGLISIVLAICYDVRTTNNEPTCESGWTRSILCPLFCYFEQFENYKDVLVAFLRRVITYPLYRNFELGRHCIKDAIEVLKGGRNWLINQMLLTHKQLASSEPSRDNYNTYYLEDYIRYVTDASISDEHLRLLARNVKNVLMDINKEHVELGVTEIETELIKELMQEMRIDAGNGSPHHSHHADDLLDLDNDTSGQDDETTTDDDSVITDSFESMDMRLIENEIVYAVDEDDEDDDEQDDDDEDDSTSSTTSTSEAEGNSVIEQCSNSNSNSEAAASASTK